MFCIFDILGIQIIVHILKCYLQIVIYQLELDLEFTFTILICSKFLTITFNLLLTFLFCIIEIILSIVIFTSTVRKNLKKSQETVFIFCYMLLFFPLGDFRDEIVVISRFLYRSSANLGCVSTFEQNFTLNLHSLRHHVILANQW